MNALLLIRLAMTVVVLFFQPNRDLTVFTEFLFCGQLIYFERLKTNFSENLFFFYQLTTYISKGEI